MLKVPLVSYFITGLAGCGRLWLCYGCVDETAHEEAVGTCYHYLTKITYWFLWQRRRHYYKLGNFHIYHFNFLHLEYSFGTTLIKKEWWWAVGWFTFCCRIAILWQRAFDRCMFWVNLGKLLLVMTCLQFYKCVIMVSSLEETLGPFLALRVIV
jgi:hypothetical protein